VEFEAVVRSAGTCREFRPDPISDAILARAFDLARFAPQGGNRQPVRWVVVRDPETKVILGRWYLEEWLPYARKLADSGGALVERANRFAERFGELPVIVVVCAEIAALHATDAGLERLSIVGGASVYPAVQNLLLACRSEGLGAALTTLLCAREPEVKSLLGIPDHFATAAHIAIGYPAQDFPTKLARRPASQQVFRERFGDTF
jgi:nitroreductase